MTRGIVRCVAALLGSVTVVAVAVPPRALAADAHVDDEREARRLFQRAELRFTLGKFPEALADYQSAYQAKPLPGFLFNIAQCYRNMADYERARFFFRRYLAIDPHAPNRRRVDDLIAEMTRQIEAHPSAADAPGASTSPPAASAIPFAPTTAPAVATMPPSLPGAARPRAASENPTVLLAATPTPEPAHRPAWKRWWFWTGVGVVVAGGVAATLLLARPSTQAPGSLQPIDGR